MENLLELFFEVTHVFITKSSPMCLYNTMYPSCEIWVEYFFVCHCCPVMHKSPGGITEYNSYPNVPCKINDVLRSSTVLLCLTITRNRC